jgi:hypothetical protein
MDELGIEIEKVLPWFPSVGETPYVLVRVNEENANGFAEALKPVPVQETIC